MGRRPVAHRGLHGTQDAENTLGAIEAAIEAGYDVEIDLQLSEDGGLAMIHDATLERTTYAEGPVAGRTLDELRHITIRGSDETVSSLTDVLALTSGRAVLYLELKAPRAHAQKAAMTAALAKSLERYGGAVAVMTFDPDLLEMLRRALTDTPVGILAGGLGKGPSLVNRFGQDMLLHMPRTRPDFVGYYALALPHPAVRLARRKRKVLAWTVRSAVEARRLEPYCDQVIFEDYRP